MCRDESGKFQIARMVGRMIFFCVLLLMLCFMFMCEGIRAEEKQEKQDDPIIPSIELLDACVGDAIRMLMEECGANFAASDDVRKKYVGSMLLTDKKLSVVLDTITKVTGLYWTKDKDGVYLITAQPPQPASPPVTQPIVQPAKRALPKPPSSVEEDGEGEEEIEEEPASKNRRAKGKVPTRRERVQRGEDTEREDKEDETERDEVPPQIVSEAELMRRLDEQSKRVENFELKVKYIDPVELARILGVPYRIASGPGYALGDLQWQQLFQSMHQANQAFTYGQGAPIFYRQVPVMPGVNPQVNFPIQQGGGIVPTVNRQNVLQGFGGFGGMGGGLGGMGGGLGGLGGVGGGVAGAGAGPGIQIEGLESVIILPSTNQLLVRATPEAFEELQRILSYIDIPPDQVEIESQFVSLGTNVQEAFGISWFATSSDFIIQQPIAAPFGFQIGIVRGSLRATLGALLNQGKARIVQAPRAVTTNGLPAILQVGEVTPILVEQVVLDQFGNQVRVALPIPLPIQILLFVIPRVNADRSVTVWVLPFVMEPGEPVNLPLLGSIPTFTFATTQAMLTVRDGESFAIGGLNRVNITRSIQHTPWLSRLPLIGGLFRGTSTARSDDNLVIFVTPRVIRMEEFTAPPVG